MSELRDVLYRASSGPAGAIDVTELWGVARARARRARVMAAAAVLVVVAAASVAVVTVDLTGSGPDNRPIGPGNVQPTAAGSSIEHTDDPTPAREGCDGEGVTCIALDREWSLAGAAFGTAWVGNIGEGPTFGVARFDPDTGEETARLHTQGFVEGFAPDDRWMWILLARDEQLSVWRVDPETTTVAEEIEIGDAGNIGKPSIAVGGGFVWVSGPEGSLTRLSSTDGTRSDFELGDALPAYSKDNGPLYLAYGEDRLWLSYGQGHVGEVDPSTGDLIRVDRDALGINAYNIVVAADRLWSSHQTPEGANVLSYAPAGGSGDRGQVELKEAIPGRTATDGDHVWVVQEGFNDKDPGWVVEVDGSTAQVVGDPLPVDIGFEGSIAVDDGNVWVTGNKVLYLIRR